MGTRVFRPLATGEALDVAVNVTKGAIGALAPLSVAAVGMAGLAIYAFSSLAGWARLTAVLAFLVVPVAMLAMAVIGVGTYFGRSITLQAGLRRSVRPVLLLLGLAVFGTMMLGFVFGVVGGLVVLAVVGISVPIMAEEELGLADTMNRTWRLSKGRRMSVFGFFSWFLLILGVLAIAVWVTSFGLERLGIEVNPDVVLWPLGFGTAVAALPIIPVGLAVMYVDARVRNEAFDLQQRLEELRSS